MTGSPSKDYKKEIDAVYPEPLSRLTRVVDSHSASSYRRQNKKKLSRSGRFRTTPVTFDEIREVDEDGEDNSIDIAGGSFSSQYDLGTRSPSSIRNSDYSPRRCRSATTGATRPQQFDSSGAKVFYVRSHSQVIPEVVTPCGGEVTPLTDINRNSIEGPQR